MLCHCSCALLNLNNLQVFVGVTGNFKLLAVTLICDAVMTCFLDQPITYLFNTLHYYEVRLRDQHALKKKLVSSIIKAVSVSSMVHPNVNEKLAR